MTKLPAAVHLVAHTPELDSVRFGMTVLGAAGTHGGRGRTIGVLQFVNCVLNATQSAVDGDVRFGSEQTTELHELVHAKVVVFHAGPSRVLAGRTTIPIPNPILPVVPADEVPTGPTIDGGVQLFEQGQRVRAQTVDVIGRHERHRAQVTWFAIKGNSQSRLIGRFRGRELDCVPYVFSGITGKRAATRRGTERHSDMGGLGTGALGPNMTDVFLSLDQSQIMLLNPGPCRDARRVLADERTFLVHLDRVRRSHDFPRRGGDDRERSTLRGTVTVGRVLSGNRIVELAVLQHLGPNPSIDAPSEVFDELAVNVG